MYAGPFTRDLTNARVQGVNHQSQVQLPRPTDYGFVALSRFVNSYREASREPGTAPLPYQRPSRTEKLCIPQRFEHLGFALALTMILASRYR